MLGAASQNVWEVGCHQVLGAVRDVKQDMGVASGRHLQPSSMMSANGNLHVYRSSDHQYKLTVAWLDRDYSPLAYKT